MPLHLLGKKSWNVYNKDNIERVRRDEAEARRKEEEEQRRARDADAEARLQLLRGVVPENHLFDETPHPRTGEPEERLNRRKRRRIEGEDDTDREIRLAQDSVTTVSTKPIWPSRKGKDVSLVDSKGHINLFNERGHKSQANEEATAEAAKKQREFEDQYTMRFSNAAGNRSGSDKPWYTGTKGHASLGDLPAGKDVWGNGDPRRKDREKKRMDANDPLAAMKKGVKQLREADKAREEWRLQRENDLNEVEELAGEEKRRRRRRDSDEESLEGFDLDKGYNKNRRQKHSSTDKAGRQNKRHRDGSSRHGHHRRRSHS